MRKESEVKRDLERRDIGKAETLWGREKSKQSYDCEMSNIMRWGFNWCEQID